MIHAFFSDPHFGHKNIIKYANRPFKSVSHQTNELVERYNTLVGPCDFVLWVGDCFLSMTEYEEHALMERLNGYKGCVIGNHDKSTSRLARAGFDWVALQLRTVISDRRVLISHYPYANASQRDGAIDQRYLDRRPKRQKGEVLIHGHTHSSQRRSGNMIHVGVDAWDYKPALFKDVAALVAAV